MIEENVVVVRFTEPSKAYQALSVLKELESSIGRPVTVRADEQLHHEQFDLMAI